MDEEPMSNESDLIEVIQAAIQTKFPPALQESVKLFVFSEVLQLAHIELAPDELLVAELRRRGGNNVSDRNYFRHTDALRAADFLVEHYPVEVAASACNIARELLNDCERADELHKRIGYLAYNLINMGVETPIEVSPEFPVGKTNVDVN